MKNTLRVINRLKREKVIKNYAIGGAVAAFFYLEPSLTDDIDVFIHLETPPDTIVTLEHLYDRLKQLGYTDFRREGIVIEEWPVQFLPATTPLEREAFEKAKEEKIEGVPVRVLTAEYLMALCVATGRAKDKVRLSQFFSEDCFDKAEFSRIIEEHGLSEKWNKIKRLMRDET